ncbi:NADH-quinone oxidoreductase subunit L [Pantoea sp. Aalb]|uniref:NADH-quinone oxidoreductase subunit L n=1 Tax=Pantoea sp. Aalb TaxID=2576762 RepID=UPI00132B5378|nr:NADH-quinone oxidoreductase subunit L [Pantoea sp. Aalb]MXP67312.1 NADH-quinone oxidoreductase subunit L [Pantoea sp. Aalb]
MNLLYLIVLFPLIGYLLLAFSHGSWSKNISAVVGITSVGISALITMLVGIQFFENGQHPFNQMLWTWIQVNNFNIKVNLILDGLSLTMLSIVTGIGFLIHVFSSWYMRSKEGYSRFFAYTNLFIASMVILVLADNLMLMYLGWELVGLCSYLLIGFYYNNIKNCNAAIKAFIITRIGDVFLALALFILYNQLGTLNFQQMVEQASLQVPSNNHILQLASMLLLCGAVGKSAQLPLQTWLADAMAGPTPVSALIHAATMVTAGVYLIARTHGLFLLTPEVLYIVSIIGTITLILAGFAALVQNDIKRILAYSTMSQIGYMFLALGVQAWNAAIFHLMIHSFFKSLLFLASGAVILACHHEQNIFKMGGLRKTMKWVYICFLIGGAGLSGLPVITSGFYSKDQILFVTLINGHISLMFIALLGSLITSIYAFRMIFIVFHGKEKTHAYPGNGITYYLPLTILLILSTFIGALITPPLGNVFPQNTFSESSKVAIEITTGIVSIIGILIASILWTGKTKLVNGIFNNFLGRFFYKWLFIGLGFDWIYDKIFVKTYLYIAYLLHRDPINLLMNLPILIVRISNKGLLMSINGNLRWYIASISVGSLIVIALMMIMSSL